MCEVVCCMTVKKKNEMAVQRAEMRMTRWMCDIEDKFIELRDQELMITLQWYSKIGRH